jgi:NAD(P)H-hydrate repair Nnr-like enzyme with NAD(P)H-hydrate epimerase domain
LKIPFIEECHSIEEINSSYDFILDAMFGFSFSGEIRQPFKDIIEVFMLFKY